MFFLSQGREVLEGLTVFFLSQGREVLGGLTVLFPSQGRRVRRGQHVWCVWSETAGLPVPPVPESLD